MRDSGISGQVKVRSWSILFAVVCVIMAVLIWASLLRMRPRVEQITAQNQEARNYIAAMTSLASTNPAIASFVMNLNQVGLQRGSIDVRVTVVSTNDEEAIRNFLHSRGSPYVLGGTIAFRDSTNLHWISLPATEH